MEDCVFCKIINREIPSTFIYEDDGTYAFLSIDPDAPGHALVIPKVHARNIFDLPTESFTPFMSAIQRIAIALRAIGAEGVNLIMNNEGVAGQAVFHAHMHVIPRHAGDGLRYGPHEHPYDPAIAAAIAEKIKAALG